MAVILAVLYFGLIELLMIDSSRALAEARQFRARVVASTLAENAAELAAQQIITSGPAVVPPWIDEQGTMKGTRLKAGNEFQLEGAGETSGIIVTRATVKVFGRVNGSNIEIDYTVHTP